MAARRGAQGAVKSWSEGAAIDMGVANLPGGLVPGNVHKHAQPTLDLEHQHVGAVGG